MAVPASATPADAVLDGLNTAQREAVLATTGPVAILAGAGTGKTRVISRRAAYAIATGATVADQVLLVTFSDRAAGEMAARISRLGQPGVTARTFHAHALSQLRWFWPSRHDGAEQFSVDLRDFIDRALVVVDKINDLAMCRHGATAPRLVCNRST
jgi:superfamily I DNA/RNA helicase